MGFSFTSHRTHSPLAVENRVWGFLVDADKSRWEKVTEALVLRLEILLLMYEVASGRHRLDTVDDGIAGVTAYDYDQVGNLESYVYPNGLSHDYAYDDLNRLTNLTSLLSSTPVSGFDYVLGPAGNRLSVTEQSTRTTTYEYDNLYRLTKETVINATVAGMVDYSYDSVGNRLTRNATLGSLLTENYNYDGNDLLGSDTYDANGNTLAASVRMSGTPVAVIDQYDYENKLTNRVAGAKTISIVYDGDGNRASKRIEFGTNVVTIGYLVDTVNPSGFAQVLEELTGGQVTRAYTVGLDLVSQDQVIGTNWVVSYFGYDGHGSVRSLTDDLGTITDTYDYDAFGTLINSTGSTPNHYLYTGEQRDPDLGLYYLRARFMDTDRGRFWNMDTFEGDKQDPISLHKYLYANTNPVMFVDPSGNFPSIAGLATVASIIGDLSTIARPASGSRKVRWKGFIGIGIATIGGMGFATVQGFLNTDIWVDPGAPLYKPCVRTEARVNGTAFVSEKLFKKPPSGVTGIVKSINKSFNFFIQEKLFVELFAPSGEASALAGDFILNVTGIGAAISGSFGKLTLGTASGKWKTLALGGGFAFDAKSRVGKVTSRETLRQRLACP